MEKKFWKITKAEDHWLEVEDPEGWYSATIKWDGCVHFNRYFNEPMHSPSRSDEDIDYIHYCDLEQEIRRLQALLDMGREHYKNDEF